MSGTGHPATRHTPNSVAVFRCGLILVIALLAACATAPGAGDSEKIDRLLTLIDQRLGYMDDVARNKWNSGAPIEDLPREREIIDGIGRRATDFGLDTAVARDFFRAQIEASKIIQNRRFSEWRARQQPPFTELPDLRDRIRPALDALTPELLTALAAALPALQTRGAAAMLGTRTAVMIPIAPADVPARDTATAPLFRLAHP